MREGEILEIWTVYDKPADYPSSFVARLWVMEGMQAAVPTGRIITAVTLDGLRSRLPPGLRNIPRNPNDEPAIVECWI